MRVKATSHLAPFLRGNFGSRSLNRENSEVAYSHDNSGEA